MNPFAAIEKLINEHGSATSLKERLALAADQFNHLEEKSRDLEEQKSELQVSVAELKSTNKDLLKEIDELQEQLRLFKPEQGGFVEHMGVLWKRSGDGYEKHPYCNECSNHPIMSTFSRFWICSGGKHQAPQTVTPPQF